jgi:hypothetical protein
MGRPATPQDTFDHTFGSGALQWSWWRKTVYRNVSEDGDASGNWEVAVTAENGDGGETTAIVDHALIMKTARHVLDNQGKTLRTATGVAYPAWSLDLERQCSSLLFNADEADLDAPCADELLQLCVLGEVVFG